MSKFASAPLCAAWVALALGGCTTPGPMSGTAMDYNETVARAADSQILLNVVRAAYRNPTHYSAITQVRDSRSIQGTAGASGNFPFGPDAMHAYSIAPSLSATGTLSPSFDVAPLDNREAATGLLHPVDAQIPLTYWQQNWPPMVLLFLFVDDVTINSAAKKVCRLEGAPTVIDNAASRIEQFELNRKLFECLAPRMKAVTDTKTKNFLTRANVPAEKVMGSLVDLDKADFDVVEGTAGDKKVYTISKEKKTQKFVMNFGAGMRAMPRDKRNIMNDPRPAVLFDFRSVDGMVYYLGELLRLQQDTGRAMTYHQRDHAGVLHEVVLFNVEINSGADPALNITADFLGDRYSVSRTPVSDNRTLTVLSLLSQLFSLYRQEKDLPKTSAVTVVGAR